MSLDHVIHELRAEFGDHEGLDDILAALPGSGIVLSAEEVTLLDRVLRDAPTFWPPQNYAEALAILRGEGQ